EPPPAELRCGAFEILRAETESRQHPLDLGMERPGTGMIQPALHLPETFKRFPVVAAFRVQMFQLLLEAFGLFMEASDLLERLFHLLQHTPFRIGWHSVLREVADRGTSGKNNIPLVRLLLSRDHTEQRRFAGTVGTGQANPFTGIDEGADPVKE